MKAIQPQSRCPKDNEDLWSGRGHCRLPALLLIFLSPLIVTVLKGIGTVISDDLGVLAEKRRYAPSLEFPHPFVCN